MQIHSLTVGGMNWKKINTVLRKDFLFLTPACYGEVSVTFDTFANSHLDFHTVFFLWCKLKLNSLSGHFRMCGIAKLYSENLTGICNAFFVMLLYFEKSYVKKTKKKKHEKLFIKYNSAEIRVLTMLPEA